GSSKPPMKSTKPECTSAPSSSGQKPNASARNTLSAPMKRAAFMPIIGCKRSARNRASTLPESRIRSCSADKSEADHHKTAQHHLSHMPHSAHVHIALTGLIKIRDIANKQGEKTYCPD